MCRAMCVVRCVARFLMSLRLRVALGRGWPGGGLRSWPLRPWRANGGGATSSYNKALYNSRKLLTSLAGSAADQSPKTPTTDVSSLPDRMAPTIEADTEQSSNEARARRPSS